MNSRFGYVGCSFDHKEWTVTAPGWAIHCKDFDAAPSPATQPEGALF
jgi:hypothetical protein